MDNNLLWQYVEEIFAIYDQDLNGYLDQKELTLFFNQVFAKINQGQTTTDQEVFATIRSVDPAFKGKATKQGIFRVLKHMLSQNFSSTKLDQLTQHPNQQQYVQNNQSLNQTNSFSEHQWQPQNQSSEQRYDENNPGHLFPLQNQNQQYKNYGNSNMPNQKQNQAYINYGNHLMPNLKQNEQYKNVNPNQKSNQYQTIQSNQNLYHQPNQQNTQQINTLNPQDNQRNIQNTQSFSQSSQGSQGSQKNLLAPQSHQQNLHSLSQSSKNNFRMTQSSQQNPHLTFQNQPNHQQVQYLSQQQQFRTQPQPQYQLQQPQYQYQNHYVQSHPQQFQQQHHYIGQSYTGHQQLYFNRQPYVSANNNDDDSPIEKYNSDEPLNIKSQQHPIENVKNVTQNTNKDDNYLRSSYSPMSHDYVNSHIPRHQNNVDQNETDKDKPQRELKTETSIGSGGKITIPSLLNP